MAEVEIKQENLVHARPKLLRDNLMHYCPGCSHGTIHNLIAEVVEEAMAAFKNKQIFTLDDVFAADKEVRDYIASRF